METQFYDRLSNDLTQLFKSGVNSDVSIEVGEEDAIVYKVHSIILQFRSLYFKNKFNEITFNDDHVKVLKLPNISVKAFDVIIKYIYSGKIMLEKLENSIIFDILIASNELKLDELIEYIQTHFVTNNSSWLRLNFTQVYRTSYQVKSFKIIRGFCDDIIAKYPNTIFESKEFHSLPEDVLISILKQDDLQLEESKIWEYVIEWGKAKNPTLPTSLDKWTSDNFSSLKGTLNHCLQHIRYFSISGEDNSIIFDILIASNELKLDELIEYIQTHFVTNNSSWLRLNFTQVYRTSYQVKSFKIIRGFCDDIIAKYPNTIFESKEFHSLPEDVLISILKQDDLQLEESKIWEYVIEWGKAKNPTLPTSLDKWTSDNFSSLKGTLNHCLQHIRYFSISGEDVIKKIYPYQQLLENQLFLDINTRLIASNFPISSLALPPRKILNVILPTRITPIPLSSNIITDEHALEISSWIDKKETPYIENNPYEFKLLVRGSRDGFDVKTIYNICDKVSNTVIVLKVEGTGEILGGFNPLEWDNNNNQHKTSRDSFIFSLRTANMENSILSRVSGNYNLAIYNYPEDLDFSFYCALNLIGNLKTEKRCYCMDNSTYYKPIRSDEFISPLEDDQSRIPHKCLFSVEEYEVFKILPRNDLNYFLLICISTKEAGVQFTQLLESSINYVQFYNSLSNDFTQLLESGVNYDVSIEVDIFMEISVIYDFLIASNELEQDELVEHLQTHLVNNNDLEMDLMSKLFVSNTVIILKVKGTGEILEGFSPLDRVSNSNNHVIYNFPSDLELGFDVALRLTGNLKTEKRRYRKDSLKYPK
ncbi:hypothetical protein Glove_164g53 [Diversispora epigaea]|uniref:BTB domain-containing protein n=1 Tax=Diversispora epigaea TaxID=1348612 RepID=A0A397J046_9GLOM|nr:hypothetical protein Glove_164g53 [Diversispora epigaea]